ncbi:kinase-like domain-containing protein [Lactarius sanguifluus]|nr:kinase-like domain-containing protein [Lactarius sanguifluus]
MLLGDKAFREHFTDPKDGSDSGMRRVTGVELLHYIDILLDQHLSNQEAYRDKGLSHVYSLLRRFTTASSLQCNIKLQLDVSWPFCLLVETIQDDALYQYTPRSSFSMSVQDFPYLLLRVSSNESHKGEIHTVLLQASCLVRLGNALLKDKSSTFFVKAIHVTHDYCAVEYTLYQNGSDPNNDKVNYRKMSHDLSNRREMFAFIFRIYNFLHSMKALHKKLSSQLTSVLTSILTESKNLPRLTREHGSDDGGSSTRWGQVSRDSLATRITLRDPRVWALIQRDGYTLLPQGGAQLKPTIGKAISSYGRVDTVTLKLLDSATEELQILRHLQVIRSEFNRTIKLLDIVQLNIPPASIVRTMIVMPWQMPLTQCLREDYFPHTVELLRIQFIEGVAFLHECGVAHLDLKPRNILVDDGHSSLSPQLSIIDFGLSLFVESEETLVEGFRGTPSWAAPEAGTEHGPAMKYSAVLADRWSCGQMLKYFESFLLAGGASVWGFTYTGLLSLDPRQRPPLTMVLRGLQGTSARKRSNDGVDGIVAQKWHRVL